MLQGTRMVAIKRGEQNYHSLISMCLSDTSGKSTPNPGSLNAILEF